MRTIRSLGSLDLIKFLVLNRVFFIFIKVWNGMCHFLWNSSHSSLLTELLSMVKHYGPNQPPQVDDMCLIDGNQAIPPKNTIAFFW
ncbi:hypothetical protein PGTUg99_009872 [Puccinia graminis f. sp. tritici]|uniref:Uncharacterized protein n=1 Tax=Puccinia graminis f. sp. tritici TaxID=56615 RepID=A0A5B0SC32_PUCGR|nr:hypothetical protein PGTUg99_009872 [Puccinia graminis f. sp. tritici]